MWLYFQVIFSWTTMWASIDRGLVLEPSSILKLPLCINSLGACVSYSARITNEFTGQSVTLWTCSHGVPSRRGTHSPKYNTRIILRMIWEPVYLILKVNATKFWCKCHFQRIKLVDCTIDIILFLSKTQYLSLIWLAFFKTTHTFLDPTLNQLERNTQLHISLMMVVQALTESVMLAKFVSTDLIIVFGYWLHFLLSIMCYNEHHPPHKAYFILIRWYPLVLDSAPPHGLLSTNIMVFASIASGPTV